MSERLSMHLKTWQKIENGITRLDIDRLKEIAEVFEMGVEELINIGESVFIHEIKDDDGLIDYNSSHVDITQHHQLDVQRELYERIIAEKDKEINFLRTLLEKKV